MTTVGELFDLAFAPFERTVGAFQGPHWDQATVCDVSVRELVQHVVVGNEFAVRLLAGATADEAVSGLDEVVCTGPDLVRAVAESCTAQTNAFTNADEALRLHHPTGEIDFDTFVRFRLGELLVHGWDLARATGHSADFDAVVVRGLWTRVQGNVDAMRSMGAYGQGARGDRADDSSVEERLLDAFGRRW